MNNCPSMVCCS